MAAGAGAGHTGRRHRAGRIGQRSVCRIGARRCPGVGDDPGVRGFHRRGIGGRRGGNGLGVLGRTPEPAGLERGHRVGERGANRAVRGARARAAQLRHGSGTDEPAILAGRRGDDAHRHHDRGAGDEQRALGVVRRCAGVDGVYDFCHDAVPATAPGAMKG